MTVTFADIEEARRCIAGAVAVTPCIASPSLSRLTGAGIRLKLENLQHTGSFKSRGALVKLAGLTPEQRARGVVAMSAGNHAQGVAYHAQRLGIPATIVMPGFTPLTKVEGTRRYGARVILHGEGFEDATAHARRLEQKRGSPSSTPTTIPPSSPARARSGSSCSRPRPTSTCWWCRLVAAA